MGDETARFAFADAPRKEPRGTESEEKTTTMAYQSVNPANGEILRSFDQHTDEQMLTALATAEETYRSVWSRMAIGDRAKIVGRAASLMLERKESLARLASLEMGKRISEGRSEVELSAAILQYYADNAE